jgi:c-di-GMP-binding flagellar brake protein YcgR
METSSRDRRQFARVKLLKSRDDLTLAVPKPFALRDISQGGFSVDAPFPFERGDTRTFEFHVLDDKPVILTGIARHCVPMNQADGSVIYVVGFEFWRVEGAHAAAVDRVVRRCLDALATPIASK